MPMSRQQAKDFMKEILSDFTNKPDRYTIKFTKMRSDIYDNAMPVCMAWPHKIVNDKIIHVAFTSSFLNLENAVLKWMLLHELGHIFVVDNDIFDRIKERLNTAFLKDVVSILDLVFTSEFKLEVFRLIEKTVERAYEEIPDNSEDLAKLELKAELMEAFKEDEERMYQSWSYEVLADFFAVAYMIVFMGIDKDVVFDIMKQALSFKPYVSDDGYLQDIVRVSLEYGDAQHPSTNDRIEMANKLIGRYLNAVTKKD